jgi:transcription-repair coupling factor (superfamily II helicase)
MADGMPALGIVAAVLGVIHTMGSIDQPPAVLGKLIGAALVGTFFGVLVSYGIVGPIASRMKALFETDLAQIAEALTVDCQIETDMRVLIPEEYVQSISERLALYTRLDEIENETELGTFVSEMEDRFGQMPNEVRDMTELVRCRWKAQAIRVEKILLKNNMLKLYFVSSDIPQEIVVRVIQFVNSKKGLCQLREKSGKMILQLDKVHTIPELNTILVDILG